MENERVGVSLTKIIENGEKLLENMDRGVKVVKEKGTVDAFNRVCDKMEEFYDSINTVQLSGNNRSKVIQILKGLVPYGKELIDFQKNVLNKQNSEVSLSPSV